MNCLSCGAEVEVDAQYAHINVCPYCQSISVLDGEAAKLSGKMAVLSAPRGRLFVGAQGRVAGQAFQVIGRVRYGYEGGYWDEWYLRVDSIGTVWISEDESDLALEDMVDDEVDWIDPDSLAPGQSVTVAGREYSLIEKGVAVCEGGEGQLPFPVTPDERVAFLDLGRDDDVATLERESDGGVRLFRGRKLGADELTVDNPRDGADTMQAERAGGDGRQRVVKQAGRSLRINCESCGGTLEIDEAEGAAIECTHCGSRVDLRATRQDCVSCGKTVPVYGGEAAGMATCPHCGARHGYQDDKLQLLEQLTDAKRPQVPFELGMPCKFDGRTFRVIGHVRYRERDEGTTYIADEFLLHSHVDGYRWLGMERGHFGLSEELRTVPRANPRNLRRKAWVTAGDTRYRVFEKGRMEIAFVDGELPWVAAVGDKVGYMDAAAPPYLLSAEWTEDEIEWSVTRYLSADEVAKAFGMPRSKLPKRRGIAPHQEFRQGAFARESAPVMAVFLLVMLVALLWAAASDGVAAGSFRVAREDYVEEYVTPEFEIKGADSLCRVDFSAPVNNSWLYLDAAVVDHDGLALHEFSADMSYYHGVEGGESWSEGSRDDSVVFRLTKPGIYSLLLKGQAGTGETPRQGFGPPLTVSVREGVVLARFFMLGTVLCLVWCLICWLPKLIFESRKWSDE